MVRLLLEAGADSERVAAEGFTALAWASAAPTTPPLPSSAETRSQAAGICGRLGRRRLIAAASKGTWLPEGFVEQAH
jgi:hypothetical protein